MFGASDDLHDRIDQLEHAIALAINRLRPFAEVHPYVAMVIDTLNVELEDTA